MLPGGYMIWMALGWTIALAVIAAILWMLFNLLRGSSRVNESPQKILNRRLAAGEIDVDEYRSRLATLSKTKRAA